MARTTASSETQGQLVGAGKSLNGRGKKSGEEKSRTKIGAPIFVLELLFSFLTFLCPIFFLARLDFPPPPPPPLTAPGLGLGLRRLYREDELTWPAHMFATCNENVT